MWKMQQMPKWYENCSACKELNALLQTAVNRIVNTMFIIKLTFGTYT